MTKNTLKMHKLHLHKVWHILTKYLVRTEMDQIYRYQKYIVYLSENSRIFRIQRGVNFLMTEYKVM